MIDKEQLFDQWSKNYNKYVIKSEKEKTYPFYGYSELKYKIYKTITRSKAKSILEMGIGTGEITKPLYDDGFAITGVDISSKMIDIAKTLMPNAKFIWGEFEQVLNQLKKYDVIIFNYSIHHLTYEHQIELIDSLHEHLNFDGLILIGDVSTRTSLEMKSLSEKYLTIWDDEEFYPIFEIYQSSKLVNQYHLIYNSLNEVCGLISIVKK